jgi:hypothetical protein
MVLGPPWRQDEGGRRNISEDSDFCSFHKIMLIYYKIVNIFNEFTTFPVKILPKIM